MGNGEEPGEIVDMEPTYTKGLPFTATCILAKNARTLYGMVPRELRAIDEAPQALTANVNGVEIGPGDKVVYSTGVEGGCPVRRGTSRRRSRSDGQAGTRIAASLVVVCAASA